MPDGASARWSFGPLDATAQRRAPCSARSVCRAVCRSLWRSVRTGTRKRTFPPTFGGTDERRCVHRGRCRDDGGSGGRSGIGTDRRNGAPVAMAPGRWPSPLRRHAASVAPGRMACAPRYGARTLGPLSRRYRTPARHPPGRGPVMSKAHRCTGRTALESAPCTVGNIPPQEPRKHRHGPRGYGPV